jgi:hypothetical protein
VEPVAVTGLRVRRRQTGFASEHTVRFRGITKRSEVESSMDFQGLRQQDQMGHAIMERATAPSTRRPAVSVRGHDGC